ncbi:ubiquitin-protein ligase [Scheffersomyces amazonensis]|uniref:ubiquitin-protein ligase n=1 Tax=Scheffersomyces amazonensis TaxID=1078765 RepID=UPI00315D54A0
MLNFTGQTKKRVVRLGDAGRSGPLGPRGSADYLHQAKLQRIQREEQRQREKSATLIQKKIRSYLHRKQLGQQIERQWLKDYNHWPDNLSWNQWFSQIPYLTRWVIPKETEESVRNFLDIIDDLLEKSPYELTPKQQTIFLDSLIVLLARGWIYRGIVIRYIDNLWIKFGSIESTNTEDLIRLSAKFIIETARGSRQWINARDLSLKVAISKPSTEIFKILSLSSAYNDITNKSDYLSMFKTIWMTSSFVGSEDGLYLLDNYLTLHGDTQFDEIDFKVLADILQNSKITIRMVPTNIDYDSSNNVISSLYSTSFIKSAITFLTDDNQSVRNSSLHIISQLVSLHPPSKSKLCMLLTITANAFRNLFGAIKSHHIYQGFLQFSQRNQDYVRYDQINQVYETINESEIKTFWDLISTFEEVYSYWLVVSNDIESFSDDRLDLTEVSEFLLFLKCLCLTLIFLGSKGSELINDIDKIKSISITLLNQLYSKNLRLKFLNKEFWKPVELKFDINALLPNVADEEEKRVKIQESFDDNDNLQDDNDDILIDDTDFNRSRKLPILTEKGNDTSYKLEVLKKLPFFIDFQDRVKVFQFLIELDKQRSVVYNPFALDDRSKLSANIRREELVHDAYDSFHMAGANLKNQLSVVFFNQYGQEAGIDGGGITKEFLTSVVKEAFNPQFELELFKETPSDNEIYPNDDIFKKVNKQIDVTFQQERLQYLRFLGTIMGKCLYENILMEISFAPFFLNKWCNENMKNSIDDLKYLDHELFDNLMKLVKMSETELNELDLNFTINEPINNQYYSFDLLPPNGEITPVTSSNKLNYIHQISNFKLNFSLHIQTRYFLDGLFQIISSSWLSMFDSYELQMLISGAQNDINIENWKENVEYGAYFDDDLTIKYFWEVVSEMTPQERFKLVKFVTSVSRAPLLGFQALSPKFGIRNSGANKDRFPTASTCINLLKLPDYQDKELIRKKLLYAINTEAGFDLS